MPSIPTQRTRKELERLGFVSEIVERWNPWARRRVDLFGFADLVALNGSNILAIQTTSGSNHAARRSKILAEPRARAWLESGGLIEIWTWAKRAGPRKKNGKPSKRKCWTCRKEAITLVDVGG